MNTETIANNPRHRMSETTRALIRNRDWEALAAIWDQYRPDASGIQRPTIPAAIRDQLKAAAAADGVTL